MYFKDVAGQDTIRQQLLSDAAAGTVPHAMLFAGPPGTGKFQMALAFARYLLCNSSAGKQDSCGTCPSCVKVNKLIHPDLHFVFPVINKKTSATPTVCDDELATWRQFIADHPYFSHEDWLEALGDTSKQTLISAKESDIISEKLALKSSQGGYKIVIIWLPEKMNASCANKMLKLLEEPPAQTLFMLVSDNPEQILDTILSRCQRISFGPLSEEEISARLQERENNVDAQTAADIAHMSGGSWYKALQALRIGQESSEYLDIFIEMMRLAYARKLAELKILSESIAERGREWQKNFLQYCQRMVRENFIFNLHRPELTYMNGQEKAFSSRFAPFINERNVIGLMDELSECQRHIEQNVNSKMVFFDFILKLIILLKQ